MPDDALAKATYAAIFRQMCPDHPAAWWDDEWANLPERGDTTVCLVLPDCKQTFRAIARAVLEAAKVCEGCVARPEPIRWLNPGPEHSRAALERAGEE